MSSHRREVSHSTRARLHAHPRHVQARQERPTQQSTATHGEWGSGLPHCPGRTCRHRLPWVTNYLYNYTTSQEKTYRHIFAKYWSITNILPLAHSAAKWTKISCLCFWLMVYPGIFKLLLKSLATLVTTFHCTILDIRQRQLNWSWQNQFHVYNIQCIFVEKEVNKNTRNHICITYGRVRPNPQQTKCLQWKRVNKTRGLCL